MMFNVPHPAALGLGVSILSYAGEVRVGARADMAVMRDPNVFVRRFAGEVAALGQRPVPAYWESAERQNPQSSTD